MTPIYLLAYAFLPPVIASLTLSFPNQILFYISAGLIGLCLSSHLLIRLDVDVPSLLANSKPRKHISHNSFLLLLLVISLFIGISLWLDEGMNSLYLAGIAMILPIRRLYLKERIAFLKSLIRSLFGWFLPVRLGDVVLGDVLTSYAPFISEIVLILTGSLHTSLVIYR